MSHDHAGCCLPEAARLTESQLKHRLLRRFRRPQVDETSGFDVHTRAAVSHRLDDDHSNARPSRVEHENCYGGKVEYYKWKLVGQGNILAPVVQPYPFQMKQVNPSRYMISTPYEKAGYEVPGRQGRTLVDPGQPRLREASGVDRRGAVERPVLQFRQGHHV